MTTRCAPDLTINFLLTQGLFQWVMGPCRAPAELTWEDFQKQTKVSKFCDSWVDVIRKVVTSSLRNQLAKDNSQVIVSYDEKLAYRVILTTGVRYFNASSEEFVGDFDRVQWVDWWRKR